VQVFLKWLRDKCNLGNFATLRDREIQVILIRAALATIKILENE
jgi:hypothetical protein